MTEIFEKILLLALIPISTIVIGGFLALHLKISSCWRNAFLHFATGVVFSVVAVELSPEILKNYNLLQIIICFSLKVAAIFLIITELKKIEPINENVSSFNMFFAIGVDVIINAILLGIGLSIGVNESILISIALSIEFLSLGIAVAPRLKEIKIYKIIISFILGTLVFICFSSIVSEAFLINIPEQATDISLSFGIAALLFLVSEKLLAETHQEKGTVWHTASFFFGFLLFLILGMLV